MRFTTTARLILSVSVFAFTLPVLAHRESKAFYVGASGIYSDFSSNAQLVSTQDPDLYGTKVVVLKKQFPNFNIFAGFRKDFCSSYFLSGDVVITPLQDTQKKINVGTLNNNEDGTLIYNNVQLKLARKYSGGVDIKYGRYFDEQTAAFISLGLLGSQFQITHSDTTTIQRITKKKNVFAWAPGAGFRYYPLPKMPITFQYNYQIYASFKTGNMDKGTERTIEYKFKNTRYHNLLLSIGWEF